MTSCTETCSVSVHWDTRNQSPTLSFPAGPRGPPCMRYQVAYGAAPAIWLAGLGTYMRAASSVLLTFFLVKSGLSRGAGESGGGQDGECSFVILYRVLRCSNTIECSLWGIYEIYQPSPLKHTHTHIQQEKTSVSLQSHSGEGLLFPTRSRTYVTRPEGEGLLFPTRSRTYVTRPEGEGLLVPTRSSTYVTRLEGKDLRTLPIVSYWYVFNC